MKIIDPNYMMDSIKIASNTPKDIAWLVKLLSGMVLFGDVELEKDREKLTAFLLDWVNNHSPQRIIWNLSIQKEDIDRLYEKAVKWIKEIEQIG